MALMRNFSMGTSHAIKLYPHLHSLGVTTHAFPGGSLEKLMSCVEEIKSSNKMSFNIIYIIGGLSDITIEAKK